MSRYAARIAGRGVRYPRIMTTRATGALPSTFATGYRSVGRAPAIIGKSSGSFAFMHNMSTSTKVAAGLGAGGLLAVGAYAHHHHQQQQIQ